MQIEPRSSVRVHDIPLQSASVVHVIAQRPRRQLGGLGHTVSRAQSALVVHAAAHTPTSPLIWQS
jgi:hypothetical protein